MTTCQTASATGAERESAACGCGGSHAPAEGEKPGGCGCGHHHAEAAESPSAEKGGCKCKGLMPFRRWHSAAGVVFGLFAVGHLLMVSMAWSPVRFDENAKALHVLASNLRWLEGLGIALPLAVVLGCGGYLLCNAGLRYDVKKCNRGGKLRFFLQRISALAILGFLAVHLAGFNRWASSPTFDPQNAYASTRAILSGGFGLVYAVYLLGLVALAYHLANGLWTAAIAWKLTATPEQQQAWGRVCLVIGGLLSLLAVAGWSAFVVGG